MVFFLIENQIFFLSWSSEKKAFKFNLGSDPYLINY